MVVNEYKVVSMHINLSVCTSVLGHCMYVRHVCTLQLDIVQ